MRSGARQSRVCTLALGVALVASVSTGSIESVNAGSIASVAVTSPRESMRKADEFRGFGRPYRFVAEVTSRPAGRDRAVGRPSGEGATVVEVRSDGFANQLVLVREPRRGDALLKVGDEVWLRPRQLHRLTRIPPELRVFGGAAISDVAAVDLASLYDATVQKGSCEAGADYVLELATPAPHVRYPRAEYQLDCRTFEPRRIDFMTEGGRVLKTVRYDAFTLVLGARIGTGITIEDHVFRDTSSVRMSQFAFLEDSEPDYTPAYLLSLDPGLD